MAEAAPKNVYNMNAMSTVIQLGFRAEMRYRDIFGVLVETRRGDIFLAIVTIVDRGARQMQARLRAQALC
jgi:hypothetical protein